MASSPSDGDPAIVPPEADPPLILQRQAEPLVREVVTRRLVLDGPAVRRRREALGDAVRAVARRIGVSPAHLGDIEQPSAAVRDRRVAALEG